MDRKFLRFGMLAAAVASMSVPVLILVADVANAQSAGRGGASVRVGNGGYWLGCPLGELRGLKL